MEPALDRSQLPLRPAVLHILLALCGEARHGLGIAEEAGRASRGTVELGPGTLYRSLTEMSDLGWVEPVETPPGEDPRRKYYALTHAGRTLLAADVGRMESVVAEARRALAGGA